MVYHLRRLRRLPRQVLGGRAELAALGERPPPDHFDNAVFEKLRKHSKHIGRSGLTAARDSIEVPDVGVGLGLLAPLEVALAGVAALVAHRSVTQS